MRSDRCYVWIIAYCIPLVRRGDVDMHNAHYLKDSYFLYIANRLIALGYEDPDIHVFRYLALSCTDQIRRSHLCTDFL